MIRTTLTIEDRLLADLKRFAQTSGKPYKQVAEEALRASLAALEHQPPAPYRLQPQSLGQPRAEVDLVKALALAETLEDDALHEKLAQRR